MRQRLGEGCCLLEEAEEYKDRHPARRGMAELEELRQVRGRRDEQRLQELIAEREREYAQTEESNGT